jgi:calcineurin-like phosphoesterase family protein
MPNFFLLSDHHFGHANILTFTVGDKGTRLRPFASIEEHDETLVQNHNKVVRPQDHFYALGDFVINKKFLHLAKRLNGHKRLVLGNHDIFDTKMYLDAGFGKVCACRVLDGFILTHIPIHAGSLGRFHRNIHGHLHANSVSTEGGTRDPRYISVCAEQINYTPISLEEIKQRIKHE